MTYRVELASRAERDFLKLPPHVQPRIAQVLDDLCLMPRPPGCKRLWGGEGFRVRIGDYRILYAVDDRARVVRIDLIGHRREVYRKR